MRQYFLYFSTLNWNFSFSSKYNLPKLNRLYITILFNMLFKRSYHLII